VTDPDWYTWHDGYDQPGSLLARRLDAVRERVRGALDEALCGLFGNISAHRSRRAPQPLEPGTRLFTFDRERPCR
jgi:hypothetical protein